MHTIDNDIKEPKTRFNYNHNLGISKILILGVYHNS